jgi:cytochrome c oxidase assembly factor CtaG
VSMTAHMLEHSVVVSVAAPLLALLVRRPLVRPLVAWPLFVATLWAINVPAVVERIGGDPVARVGAVALMLVVAVLFWLPALTSLRGLGAGAYLFAAAMASDLIGAWYMAMGETAAGVAMVAGMLPMAAGAVVLTWNGLVREERETARLETYVAR